MVDTINISDSSSDSEVDSPTWDIKQQTDNTWLVSNINLKDEDFEIKEIGNDPLGEFWQEHLSDILVGYCLKHSGPPLAVTKILSAQRINYPPDIFGYHMFCKVEAALDEGLPHGYMFSEVNISVLDPTSFLLDVRFCKIVDQSSVEYKEGGCKYCPDFVVHPREVKTIALGQYTGFNPLAGKVKGAHWLTYADDQGEFPVEEIPMDSFYPCDFDPEPELESESDSDYEYWSEL